MPVDPTEDCRVPSYEAPCPLSFHRQRKPAWHSARCRLILPGSAATEFHSGYAPDHGRIETRKIWTTTELNGYLDFPHVGQAFVIERQFINKKNGKSSCEVAYGVTSRTAEQADPQRILKVNRATGPLKIAVTISSIGITMKIAVGSAPATVRKTSPDSADSPLESLNPKAYVAYPRK